MSDEETKVEYEVEDSGTEIEVVDDTPEQDRGRTPLKEEPAEVTDDELSKYSDQKLKDRLAHLGKGFHDARRQKEAALRERDEAVRLAQQVAEENRKLQGSLSTNQTALLEQAKKVVAAELEAAKAAYKKAHEEFDADALLAAQEKLIAAKTKAERVNNFKPTPVQQPQTVVQTAQPQVDAKTQEWVGKNQWFEKDKKMRTYALALHDDLVESGVPVASDEYFKRIDEDVRKRFPEAFTGNHAEANTSQRSKSNVAPAGRSTATKKIVLTQTQVALAKRLGLPLDVYARSVAELKGKQA